MPGHVNPAMQNPQTAKLFLERNTAHAGRNVHTEAKPASAPQHAPSHADGGHVAWKHDDNQAKATGAHHGKLHDALEKFAHHHEHAGHGDLGHAFDQLFHHHTGVGEAVAEVVKHAAPQPHHAHVE